MTKKDADELAASMLEILGWLENKTADSWSTFLAQLQAAGNDCRQLDAVYRHWVERGTLNAAVGEERAGQGMMMIRRLQRQNNCPMN